MLYFLEMCKVNALFFVPPFPAELTQESLIPSREELVCDTPARCQRRPNYKRVPSCCNAHLDHALTRSFKLGFQGWLLVPVPCAAPHPVRIGPLHRSAAGQLALRTAALVVLQTVCRASTRLVGQWAQESASFSVDYKRLPLAGRGVSPASAEQ